MSLEPASNAALSIIDEQATVVMVDIVGFTRKTTQAQQTQLLEQLGSCLADVASQSKLRGARRRTVKCIPTGDGFALAFFGKDSQIIATQSAIKLATELRRLEIECEPPRRTLRARIGINCGRLIDISNPFQLSSSENQRGICGSAINDAERVMSMGDAGHILCTGGVYEQIEDLEKRGLFKSDFYMFENKHGEMMGFHSIYAPKDSSFGSQIPPSKLCLRAANAMTLSAYYRKKESRRKEKYKVLKTKQIRSIMDIKTDLALTFLWQFFADNRAHCHQTRVEWLAEWGGKTNTAR